MHIIESLIASRKRQSVLAINLYFQLSVKRNYLFNIHCLHTVSINECFGVAIIEKAGPRLGDHWLGPGALAGAGQGAGPRGGHGGGGRGSGHSVDLQLLFIQLKHWVNQDLNFHKKHNECFKRKICSPPHQCEKCQLASTLTLNDVHIITVILYNLYSFWTLGAIARS